MDLREKDRLLLNLRSLPGEIEDLLYGISDDVLSWCPAPDKWCIKEILCHLRDIDKDVYLNRYRKMVEEDDPILYGVDADKMAAEGDYMSHDAATVLSEFDLVREELVEYLEGLPEEAWSRKGVHDTAGPITIHGQVVRQGNHDVNHLDQMKDIIRIKVLK